MQEFAFLFHQSRDVSPNSLPTRNAAAREWALARREEGSLRSASPLEDDGFIVTRQDVSPVIAGEGIASVLVIEASDLQSAVMLAKAHPGLAFGTAIEVRPVKVVALR